MPQAIEVHGLDQLGWGADFEREFIEHAAAGLVPGRVAVQRDSTHQRRQPAAEKLPPTPPGVLGRTCRFLARNRVAGGDGSSVGFDGSRFA